MILLAAAAALLFTLYHYAYKARLSRRLTVTLSLLRFLSLFALFLLVINPEFSSEEYRLEPPNLVLLSDNSSSMLEGNANHQLLASLEELTTDTRITERFKTIRYSFGSQLKPADRLDFTEGTTNLAEALSALNAIYARTNTAVVLLTDGNQTLGRDYEYVSGGHEIPVYPLAVGDTTRYEDLRLGQVILNKYAFLKNSYPLETFVTYEGSSVVNSTLTISVDGRQVAQERLRFSPESGNTRVHTLLEAGSVGIKDIRVSLSPLEQERNTANNERRLAIEVIDEKTTVGLVSSILHPDLGALERTIESNEQRSVVQVLTSASGEALKEIDLFVLYQPTPAFRPIYDWIRKNRVSTMTITGVQTHWDFLNEAQDLYQKEGLGQQEEVLPVMNPAFGLFDLGGFSVADFPPLTGELGDVLITKPHEVLLGQRIRGVDMPDPLFVLIDGDARKEAVLFGENLWKWRMQSYRNKGSFESFDGLFARILRYLTHANTKERLTLEYNPVFEGTREAQVRATYYDETYLFDPTATLLFQVQGVGNEVSRELPMLLKGSYYEADLSDLPPGKYQFTAMVEEEAISERGNFTILDFDVEKQLLATDYRKLDRLAGQTGGNLYFPSDTGQLIEKLSTDDRYLPTQKSKLIVVSLIDYRWLLAIIATALAAEWFLRKYNGLI